MLSRIPGQQVQVPAAAHQMEQRLQQIPPVLRVKFQERLQDTAGILPQGLLVDQRQEQPIDPQLPVVEQRGRRG